MSNSSRNRPTGKQRTSAGTQSSRPAASRSSSPSMPAAPRVAGTTGPGSRRSTATIVAAVVAIVVVVAAVIAITSTTGDDERTDAGPSAADAGAASADGGSSPAVPAAAAGTASPDGENRAVTLGGSVLPPYDGDDDAALGVRIPTATGQDFAGAPVEIRPGAPTLLVFLAHWCPHCQAEVPRLVAWHGSGEVPEGVDVIAVSTGVDEGRGNHPPSQWLAGEGWPWPVLADDTAGSVGRAFGLSSFPYFVFYDAEGTVRFRMTGEVPMDELTERIEAALA